MFAEHLLDRLHLGDVTQRSGSSVRVDVSDFRHVDAAVVEALTHRAHGALATGCGLRHVMRIGAHSVADYLRKDVGTSLPSAVE